MLTQLRRALPSKFDSSYGRVPSGLAVNARPVTATQTQAIASTSCRFRIKRSKYPLVWVKEQLKIHDEKPRILTLNQYLSQNLRGTRIDHFHAPINKRFHKKIHAFNPFVRVDPAVSQEAYEHYEYFWAKKEHGKSGTGSVTQEQIAEELAALQSKQSERRKRREQRVKAALSPADVAKQAERKQRIAAKKQKARDDRESKNRVDDDYDEPEPASKSSEFVF